MTRSSGSRVSRSYRRVRVAGLVVLAGVVLSAVAEGPSLLDDPFPPPHESPALGELVPPAPRPLAGNQAPRAAWTRDEYTSVQVNVDPFGQNIPGDAANEPSIAIDPSNSARIVIGWRQFDSVASDFRQAGWAYSHDAGQSWHFPGVLQEGVRRSDPVVDADAAGNFYFYSLHADAGTYTCQLFKSIDGGVSWSIVGPQNYGGDKPWFAIDRTGGIGHGNIYAAWDNRGCCEENAFTRSTDGGQTFDPPIPIPEWPIWGEVAVGPEGNVYIAGRRVLNATRFTVVRSSTAKDPDDPLEFDFGIEVDLAGRLIYQEGYGPNPDGLLGQVEIVADHSSGPTRGNVYVLCSVRSLDPLNADPLDIHFIRSTNGGITWSSPVRLNDDPEDTHAWQWFGTLSVAPTGRIDVLWNDTRNDPTARSSELYYCSSSDGGLTWTDNMPVSPSFDHTLGYPGGQRKLGDYYDTISDSAGVHVAYAANFNGEQDIYYLRIIAFDCNDNGIADADDIAAGTSLDCNDNAVPDECELEGADCNENGVLDACDIAEETSEDCQPNGIPDECELPGNDCNGNSIPDTCDVAAHTSPDCQSNQVPDECELLGNDCNASGIPDECELAGNDCNTNGLPDECDLAGGTSLDCQPNGFPDECELSGNDCDASGIPDDCELAGNDCNANGVLDECELADNDCNANGVLDACDIAAHSSLDCQPNGIPDECELAGNDCNSNGRPDECDLAGNDCDGSGVPDECELAGNDCNYNGTLDACDIATGSSVDCQPNGLPDECEVVGNDCNANGRPDECDLSGNDCNANSTPDECDISTGFSADCQPNGLPDECELAGNDCNGSGVPDECELSGNDCNANGSLDECDVSAGTSADCQPNGLPDECELVENDCNSNGVPDECDLSGNDCNANGLPDECELSANDCNANGILDECDISALTSPDCQPNGVPDECELRGNDCNMNDVPDDCDIIHGASDDDNGNGIPDECEPEPCLADYSDRLVPATADDGDYTGYSVAISDGVAIVGAYGDDDNGSSSGSAYVFRTDGSVWHEEAHLLPPDVGAGDRFAWSVDVSGEVALIGAVYDADQGTNSGSAYVFRFDGVHWIQEAKLLAGDGASYDLFGYSVALSGNTAVVGARYEDDAGSNAGAAYVFGFDGSMWNQQAKLTASDGARDDFFGYAVAIDGDTVVVGAYGNDDFGAASGSAYVYRFDGSTWVESAKLLSADGAAGDWFGCAVDISPGLTVVGARYASAPAQNSGAVYLFSFTGGEWVQQAKLSAADGAAYDYFGTSVATSGSTVIVGAEGDDDRGRDAGVAHVFHYDGTKWVGQAKALAVDGYQGDLFGFSVDLSGGTAVVGAYYAREPSGDRPGRAYIFQGFTDCNANTGLDVCDIVDGISEDADLDGVPDECGAVELGDFNRDGLIDLNDLPGFADCATDPGNTPDPVQATVVRCLETFDFDSDTDVDLHDYIAFEAGFTR